MTIEILEEAKRDLVEGFHFYENQQEGLGSYFLTNLYADIESLKIYADIHNKPHAPNHRLLSKKFPFASFLYGGEQRGFRPRSLRLST